MMQHNTQDDAKPMPWLFLFLRRRRFLTLLIGLTTFILIPLLFFFQTSSSSSRDLNLKAKEWWSWSSSSSPFWPHESANVEDVLFPPDHPTYILFEPPSFSAQVMNEPLTAAGAGAATPASVVRPVRSLSKDCLDAHFESGKLCNAGTTPDPPLDVLWTWVNGSDKFLMESMAQAVRRNDPKMPTTSRPNTELFRDHNELLHSVRSVLQHFRPSTKQLHILTSDFPFKLPVADGNAIVDIPRRLGLAPSWLDLTDAPMWQDEDVTLSMVYHSQVFQNYQGVFNSYAIESQIKNLKGLSDNFVYMNDDFFMLADLSKPDFYTSSTSSPFPRVNREKSLTLPSRSAAYGTVIRLQADLQVKSEANPRVPAGGEWGPLSYTNWCLSNRFGSRSRPYIAHTAKSLSLPLMTEFQSMWKAQLEVTASHPFRGMTDGNRDIYAIFLFTHTLVERWREALLWSWAIGKLSPIDGQWGAQEKYKAWQSLGGDMKKEDMAVTSTFRSSAKPDEVRRNLEVAGHTLSGRTNYVFVSGDGYPYGFMQAHPKRVPYFPRFTSSPEADENGHSGGTPLCTLSYSKCFNPQKEMSTANDFFKHVAFDEYECGDCIINALRARSGSSGLSAFLPPHDRIYKSVVDDDEDDDDTLDSIDMDAIARMNPGNNNNNEDDDVNDTDFESRSHDPSYSSSFTPPPHLPLVSHYQEGDFSLTQVLPRKGKTNIREWTLELLQRYRFVIGDTATRFQMIKSLSDARNQMGQVDRDKASALLCINDNIMGVTAAQADVFLRDWQDRRWSRKASWERP